MGLDIFVHKCKKSRSHKNELTTNEIYNLSEEQYKEKMVKALKRFRAKMESVSNEKYGDTYVRGLKSLGKHFDYPHLDLNKLGYNWDYSRGKAEYKYRDFYLRERLLKAIDENFDKIVDGYYGKNLMYFRKVNFLYRYFQHRLKEESCEVYKADLEDIINRCDKVLADHKMAEKLLPTQCGFFFGSTEYDKWYFDDVKDVKKQCEKALKGLKDNEVMAIYMSW